MISSGYKSKSVSNPPIQRPLVPATTSSRTCARTFFPLPAYKSPTSDSISPKHPHLSWLNQRHLLLGLKHAILPRELDLTTPRVGRTFVYAASQKNVSGRFEKIEIPVAMYPVSPLTPHVPPYPGAQYENANMPNSPAACYSDGSRGAFDARRYPQLFDSRRPWLVFHDSSLHLTWDKTTCELMNPTEFFEWNQPGNPGCGGRWVINRLDALFSQRERMESQFSQLVHRCRSPGCSMAAFVDQHHLKASFDLPYYDPLEWADVRQWSTWGEGRERLANTLQYTAELKTLNRYLEYLLDLELNPNQAHTPDHSYMGAWATTIATNEDWKLLLRLPVPLYIITRIPKGHLLHRNLTPGNPDGDERYRLNTFDAAHSFTPHWLVRSNNAHQAVPDMDLECRPEYLPSTLSPASRPTLPANATPNSSLLTWRSPLYLEKTLHRFDLDTLSSQQDQVELRRALDELFPFQSAQYRVLRVETDRHPLLDVIGSKSARDNALTRYMEEYDEDDDAYYPKRLGKNTSATKSLLASVSYRWRYSKENIEILSNYPFPGRALSFGRIVDEDSWDDEDDGVPAATSTRRYFEADPALNKPRKLAFVWEAYETIGASPSIPSGHGRHRTTTSALTWSHANMQDGHLMPESRISDQQLCIFEDPVYDEFTNFISLEGGLLDEWASTSHNLDSPTDYARELAILLSRRRMADKFLSYACTNVVLQDIAAGELGLMTPAEREEYAGIIKQMIITLKMQRSRLAQQIQRRIFKSARHDDLVCQQAVPWHITDGPSDAICYPVRFSGLHGDVPSANFFAMLKRVLGVYHHEVILFASYREVDTTQTIDIAFRYCEDAMFALSTFHGVEIDDRLVEVQFIRAIVGQVHAVASPLDIPEDERRPPLARLQRIVALLAQPSIARNLLNDAYQLERDITNWILSNSINTKEEVMEIKMTERRPIQLVITGLDSLLSWEDDGVQPVSLTVSQSVSLPRRPVPTDEALTIRHVFMTGGIRWEESPNKSRRASSARGANASWNTGKHKAIPAERAASTMSSLQRQNLLRAIRNRTSSLISCWKPDLQLADVVLSSPNNLSAEAMKELYEQLWDWQDDCLLKVRTFREQNPMAEWDYSSFELAFGALSRLDALRGDYYTVVAKALQDRTQGTALQ